MKHFKYLFFVFVLFLTPNVFATSIKSDTYSQKNGFNTASRFDYTTNNLMGDDYSVVSTGTYNTTYNGKSYYFQFNVHHTLSVNKTYDLKISSTTSDFTSNINIDRVVPLCYASFSSSFNEYECSDLDIQVISVIRENISSGQSKSFTIRFKTTNDIVYKTYWGFKISGGMNNLTGVSNFKITDIDLKEVNSSDNTDTIINNNNQNTQNIIDNQTNNTNSVINNNNQNTNAIINNNNQNTQQITDSINNGFTSCRESSNILNFTADSQTINGVQFSKKDDGTIVVNGTANSNTFYYLTGDNYNSYLPSGSYFLNSFNSTTSTSTWRLQLMFENAINDNGTRYFSANTYRDVVYGGNYKAYIVLYSGFTATNLEIKPMLSKGSLPLPYEQFGQICTNRLDDTTNAINETNQYLQDDSDPSIQDNDFLSMFNSVGVNDPLSYLLTLPTQLINKLVSLSDTCTSINLGTLYGVMISLPCINLENILGSSVWNIIDVIFSVSLLVVILKNLYDTFSNLLTMGAEKEAKEKFSMPTPMDFLSMILGGDR